MNDVLAIDIQISF